MSHKKRFRALVRHFHENGLKFVLENPDNVRELLHMLDVRLLPRLDFPQMRVVPGRYVQRDYRHVESELVLQVPVLPGPGGPIKKLLLYILIEHQSEPDRFMTLRVLEYVVMIYKRQLRDWERTHGNLDHCRLQPVLPVVLYTGTRTWEKLGNLWELIDLGEELAERIPVLEPLFLNVGGAGEAVLTQRGGVFGMFLRLLQQRRTRLAVFEKTLHETVQALEALAETDRHRWLELVSYIMALIRCERDEPEREPLSEIVAASVANDVLRQEVFDMGKTSAEVWMEQGEARGMLLGELKNQRNCLMRTLQRRFGKKLPAALVKKIEATDRLDLLYAWFDQALTAEHLSEISFATE